MEIKKKWKLKKIIGSKKKLLEVKKNDVTKKVGKKKFEVKKVGSKKKMELKKRLWKS